MQKDPSGYNYIESVRSAKIGGKIRRPCPHCCGAGHTFIEVTQAIKDSASITPRELLGPLQIVIYQQIEGILQGWNWAPFKRNIVEHWASDLLYGDQVYAEVHNCAPLFTTLEGLLDVLQDRDLFCRCVEKYAGLPPLIQKQLNLAQGITEIFHHLHKDISVACGNGPIRPQEPDRNVNIEKEMV